MRLVKDVLRWRKPVIGILTALLVGAGGFLVYMKLVEHGYLKYNKWDRRVRGTLRVGHQAPDFELTAYDGSPLRLSSVWATRPAVLIFGSCT